MTQAVATEALVALEKDFIVTQSSGFLPGRETVWEISYNARGINSVLPARSR
jgi:hypothetical protein